jgi:hypothetical protein
MVESEAPRPASSSFGAAKVRFLWFKTTQLLLLIYMLFVSCSLVYVQTNHNLSQTVYSVFVPGICELVLVVLTVVPQAVICALYRQRPPTWMWIDFGFGFVQFCLCVSLLWDRGELSARSEPMRIGIESALLLTVALRMYARQVVFSDIGRSC